MGALSDQKSDVNQERTFVDFVVDSGATHNYVNDETFLSGCKSLRQPFEVTVAKAGQSLKAIKGGRMNLVTHPSEREKVNILLEEVFYTPDLVHNLFSVRRVEAAGGKVVFSDGKVVVENKGTVVAVGKRVGNLYKLRFEVAKAESGQAHIATSVTSATDLWHRRLGHLGMSNVARLINGGLVGGKLAKMDPKGDFCETCTLGKMSKLPYCGSRPRAANPLDRIHSDLCGPMETTAIDGSRYFVTFIDDHTHFTVTYLLKEKGQVLEKLQQFVDMASGNTKK